MNDRTLRPRLTSCLAMPAWVLPAWVMLAWVLLGVVGPLAAQESPSEVADRGTAEQGNNLDVAGDDAPQPGAAAALGRVVASLTIFVLAIFVGFEVIAKVPPTLHTPLMSGSNAISGITLVGAVLMAGFGGEGWGSVFAAVLGMLAVVLATINVVGGFMVTDRMLAMFKKK